MIPTGDRTASNISVRFATWCFSRAADVLLALVASVVLTSLLVLAGGHIGDRWGVDSYAGVYMGLAQHARHGTLFPPLYRHGYFGGTRYMPLPVVLDAAASLVTGEFAVAAKIVVYVTAVLLFVLMYLLLRTLGCAPVLGLALVASVAVTPVGIEATTYIRHDGLAVLLQLGAVALVYRSRSTGSLTAAGGFSALALAGKFDAVWAPMAIAVWLFLKNRQGLRTFLASFTLFVAGGIGLFELVSDGRLVQQLEMFAFVRNGGPAAWPHGARVLFSWVGDDDRTVLFLFPVALTPTAVALWRRRPTMLQIALLIDLPVLVVVFSTRGIGPEHLVDLSVLTAMVVGEAVGRLRWRQQPSLLSFAVALFLAGSLAATYRQELWPTAAEVVKNAAHARRNSKFTYSLLRYVRPNDVILSDEPNIPVLLGQRPVVLDAFLLHYLLADHPAWRASLLRRVSRSEFDKIVVEPFGPGTGAAWEFGPAIVAAIERNYRLAASMIGLGLVYVPRRAH